MVQTDLGFASLRRYRLIYPQQPSVIGRQTGLGFPEGGSICLDSIWQIDHQIQDLDTHL
jgi:hypothetical protein